MRIEPTENMVSVSGGRAIALRLMIGDQLTAVVTKVTGPSQVMLQIKGSQVAADLERAETGWVPAEGEAIAVKVEGMTPEGVIRMRIVEPSETAAPGDIARRETDSFVRVWNRFQEEIVRWIPDFPLKHSAVVKEFVSGGALQEEGEAQTLARMVVLGLPLNQSVLRALHRYFQDGGLVVRLRALWELLKSRGFLGTTIGAERPDRKGAGDLARFLQDFLHPGPGREVPIPDRFGEVFQRLQQLGLSYDRDVVRQWFPLRQEGELPPSVRTLKPLLLQSLDDNRVRQDPPLRDAIHAALDGITGQQLLSRLDHHGVAYRLIPVFYSWQGVLQEAELHLRCQPKKSGTWDPDSFSAVLRAELPALGRLEAVIQAIERHLSIVIHATRDLSGGLTDVLVDRIRTVCRSEGYYLSGIRCSVRSAAWENMPPLTVSMMAGSLDMRG